MLTIMAASAEDVAAIQEIYSSLRRPTRMWVDPSEYLIARVGGVVRGCAGVRLIESAAGKEGYLYGLAVQRSFHRNGAGRALTEARVDRVRDFGGSQAIALAMFWNISFFRKLGFDTVARDSLSPAMRDLSDFRDVRYRRSAVVRKSVGS